MKHLRTLSPSLLLVLCACGDAPRPLDPPTATGSPHGAAGAGSPHASGEFAGFRGWVRLRGELADVQEGVLYLIARPVGSRIPVLTEQVRMDDHRITADEGGGRSLPFVLDSTDAKAMGGGAVQLPAGEMEVEARYDRDGYVDTKDDTVSDTRTAAVGATGLEFVLGG